MKFQLVVANPGNLIGLEFLIGAEYISSVRKGSMVEFKKSPETIAVDDVKFCCLSRRSTKKLFPRAAFYVIIIYNAYTSFNKWFRTNASRFEKFAQL